MRILLTGATGFVASAFLRSKGAAHEVTVLGRRAPSGEHAGGQRLDHVECDFNAAASVVEALKRLEERPPFDAVVHLAVSRLHRTFPQTALDLFNVNLAATAHLLDFAHRTGAGQVLLGSTGSVYHLPFGERAAETDFLPPKSYFAATKQAADALAVQYRGLLPVTILRFFVPYGPHLEDRMLSGLVDAIRNGRPLTVPLEQPPLVFSPIYVDDAVSVIETALAQRWNETVNVATGEEISIVEAGRIVADRLGMEMSVRQVADAGSFYLVPRIDRLRALMPGHDFVPFERGVEAMLAA